MITKLDKNKVRKKRHARVRVKVQGTTEVPRFKRIPFKHKHLRTNY